MFQTFSTSFASSKNKKKLKMAKKNFWTKNKVGKRRKMEKMTFEELWPDLIQPRNLKRRL